jgi:hypothetical protein
MKTIKPKNLEYYLKSMNTAGAAEHLKIPSQVGDET